jgi:hypothetical protein
MKERRLRARFLCADLVRIDWVAGNDGAYRRVQGVLEDISTLGACVQVEEEIPPGSQISLSTGDTFLSGSVSYCVYQGYGYFVGINFADDNRWTESNFEPQHLTNLADLSHRRD